MKGVKRFGAEHTAQSVIGFCGMAALGILSYFALTTVYGSDDYWYSTFWDKGILNYLELMDYHYRAFNGRTLVHVLAHILLHFDNWLFALVCCAMMIGIPVFGGIGCGLPKKQMAAASTFFVFGVLVMPTSYMTQGVMWISAFCNYVFPVWLLCGLIACYERSGKGLYLMILAFLCGATTEQSGLAALAVAAAYAVDAGIRRKGLVRCLGAAASAAAGLMTIFFSPATMHRAESHIHLSQLINDIYKAIGEEAARLTENPVPVVLMLVFFALAAIMLGWGKGQNWVTILCGIGAAALLMGCVSGGVWHHVGFIAAFCVLLLLSVVLMVLGERGLGAMLLSTLASAAVMLPTNTIVSRVMIPFYLLLLVCDCLMLVRIFRKKVPLAILAAGILTAAVVCLIPAVKGYWHNYQVDQVNKAYAEADRGAEELNYCTDYDMTYTMMKAHDDHYFREKYLESVGMPTDQRMHFRSSQDALFPQISCAGEMLTYGSIENAQGITLMPLRAIVERFGGVVEWTPECTMIHFDNQSFSLVTISDVVIRVDWTDPAGESRQRELAQGSRYGDKYLELAFFSECLGLSVSLDSEVFCYTITR